MMVVAGDVSGDRHHLLERDVSLLLRSHAELIPCRAAIHSDLSPRHSLLERDARESQTRRELLTRHAAQLLPGVVQVVHVDRTDTEILSAFREAVFEESRREA